MTVEVKISGIVSTQRYGTLETGDILRTDPEYARFLVEDCQAGEYVKPPQVATVNAKKAPKTKEKKQPDQPLAGEAGEEATSQAAQAQIPQE